MSAKEFFYLDFEPGMTFTADECKWLADHLKMYGKICQSVVRPDAERGDLEMRFERRPIGICGRVRRLGPRAKKPDCAEKNCFPTGKPVRENRSIQERKG